MSPGQLVVLYASSPSCAVVGVFRIGRLLSLPVPEFWRRYSQSVGVDRESFDDYFDGATFAIGLEVAESWRIRNPPSLQDLRTTISGFRPPQSFRYVGLSRSAKAPGVRLRLERGPRLTLCWPGRGQMQ